MMLKKFTQLVATLSIFCERDSMRLLEIDYAKHKMMILCTKSIVKINISQKGFLVESDIFSTKSKFVGIVKDTNDAFIKFPEYFL